MTDEKMADAVCASIDMHGHDRCSEQSEWDELKKERDWVRALLAERNALLAQIADSEQRAAKSAAILAKVVGLMRGTNP
jgi:hypothetical protein